MPNTKQETPEADEKKSRSGDLEGFRPSPPEHRIDDKAATLEEELQDTKLKFGRERFMYVFIMTVLFVCLVGPALDGALLFFLIVAALIFTVALGKYLDFPWAVLPLERWHDLLFRYCEKKLLGKNGETDVEPFDNEK